MHPQHVGAAFAVGAVYQHLAVESARTQQCRVQHLGPVGRGQDHHTGARVEAVHLGQQLVQGLFFLVMAASHRPEAAGPTQRIEFVDEDDARRRGAGLFEQVAHPRCADANEHLDELRAGDAEERHAGLAGHRPRQQGLACAWRADQQHALGHVRAEPAVGLGVFQKINRLAQLGLGLVDARDIVESDLDVGLGVQLGAALAHRQQAADTTHSALGRHLAAYETPHAQQQQRRQHPAQQVAQQRVLDHALKTHVVVGQLSRQVGRHPGGDDAVAAIGLRALELALDELAADRDRFDLAGLELLHELAVGNRLNLGAADPQVTQPEQRDQRQQQGPQLGRLPGRA